MRAKAIKFGGSGIGKNSGIVFLSGGKVYLDDGDKKFNPAKDEEVQNTGIDPVAQKIGMTANTLKNLPDALLDDAKKFAKHFQLAKQASSMKQFAALEKHLAALKKIASENPILNFKLAFKHIHTEKSYQTAINDLLQKAKSHSSKASAGILWYDFKPIARYEFYLDHARRLYAAASKRYPDSKFNFPFTDEDELPACKNTIALIKMDIPPKHKKDYLAVRLHLEGKIKELETRLAAEYPLMF